MSVVFGVLCIVSLLCVVSVLIFNISGSLVCVFLALVVSCLLLVCTYNVYLWINHYTSYTSLIVNIMLVIIVILTYLGYLS